METVSVKCSRCGDFVEVPPELLGDTPPSEVTEYVCDACEDNDFEDDGIGYDDDRTCDACNGTGQFWDSGEPCSKCDGEGYYWWL